MLSRKRNPTPKFVMDHLWRSGQMKNYLARPPYQQNDYVGWIVRAKKDETKQKRLNQMIDELKKGDKYMKMDYRARKDKSKMIKK